MQWHEADAKSVLKELNTGKQGLSEQEADSRIEKYGPNEIVEEKKAGAFEILTRQFASFLVIILVVAAIFSAFIAELLDTVAIILIVFLNAIFGFFQEYKAEKSIEALKNLAAQESIVIRGGRKTKISSRLLVPGDIILLEQGDKVPADTRLLDVVELKVDESALTGESIAVAKTTRPSKSRTLAEMKCMAFMGTIVAYGRATGVVVKTGMDTEVGKISHSVQTTERERTPLQVSLDRLGKSIGLLIIAVAALIIAVGFVRGLMPINIIVLGIALAVAAVPEGLPAVVTVTLAVGMQRMARKNAIVRKLQAVETLGSVSIICSDKTGTMTKGEMTVRKIWADYKTVDVMGTGYEPKGDFLLNGNKIDHDAAVSMLLRCGALCTNAQLRQEQIIGDPTEGAILVAAEKFGLNKEKLEEENPRKTEIPFTSERKMMSTVNRQSKLGGARSYIMCTKGAPEVLLHLCDRVFRNGKTSKLAAAEKKTILDINHDMTIRALRVLAVAYKETEKPDKKESGLVFLGFVGMIDPPRGEVKEDIKACKESGIRTVMITGDHKNTAVAIAEQLGIEGRVLTGEELENMGMEKLAEVVDDIAVYARVNPEHKAMIVDALKKRGHIIAMTGDGVNDAPALKKADIGIAMGIKGTDVAKEASDIVLTDDNFSSIVSAVREGRTIYDNIKSFILYLLSSNIAEVMVVFAAVVIGFTGPSGLLIPLTALQLLWINLITDGFPALALGLDPPLKDVMRHRPRDLKERLLSKSVLSEMIVIGLAISTIIIFIFAYSIASPARAVTLVFTLFVVLELANVMRIRLEKGHAFFSNKKLLAAVAVSFALQLAVIYTPLQTAFDTVPLVAADWALMGAGLLVFVLFSVVRISVTRSRRA